MSFSFPKMGPSLLVKRACAYYNQRERAKAARLEDLYAEIQFLHERSPKVVLEHACLNYLHHVAEKQDIRLAQWRGHSQHFENYAQLKGQMLDAICAHYPWLNDACERQRLC